MFTEDHTWLTSRASLGEALATIGVPEVADIELAPLSASALVFKYDGLFYRFAINKWQARRMIREQALLERIGPRLSCKVPEITDSSLHPVFHAYRGIEGVEIDQMNLAGLDPSRRDRVLTSVARFLVELHRCDTGWCDKEDRYIGRRLAKFRAKSNLDNYDEIDPSGTAKRFAEETVAMVEAAWPADGPIVLLHGDLSSTNILVNPDRGHLTGIIDFTMWSVGDPHWDFRFLRGFAGDEGLRMIVRIYEEDGGTSLDMDLVMALERARICLNLTAALPTDHGKIAWLLDRISRWRPLT